MMILITWHLLTVYFKDIFIIELFLIIKWNIACRDVLSTFSIFPRKLALLEKIKEEGKITVNNASW